MDEELGIAELLAFAIGCIEKKTDPKRRPRRLPKGITTEQADEVEKTVSNSIANDVLITVEHLKKVYPNETPLKDVNTVIRRGKVITVIGPSGKGKITVFGENVCDKKTDLALIRRKMGMVFQSFNLF